MYRGLEDRARRGDGLDEEPGILERDDDEVAAGGLRGKQERLLRAAKLLNQGAPERDVAAEAHQTRSRNMNMAL